MKTKNIIYGHKWMVILENNSINIVVSDCIIFKIVGSTAIKRIKRCIELIRSNKNRQLICMTEFVMLK